MGNLSQMKKKIPFDGADMRGHKILPDVFAVTASFRDAFDIDGS